MRSNSSTSSDDIEHLDVLILGAGVSGVNAAWQVRHQLPSSTFAVLEGRDTIGGTWKFWKYPGFRCDSSMSSYAFNWYLWKGDQQVVSGQTIADYVDEAVDHEGLRKYFRLGQRVKTLDWVSSESRWMVEVLQKGEEKSKMISAKWVISCMGYYSYDKPLKATIPGLDNFGGQVIHPQFWPDDADCKDKNVVILGSGSTAMTIFPALADTTKHITLLQRSPSYVASLPSKSRFKFLFRLLPFYFASHLVRFLGLVTEHIFVLIMRGFPTFSTKLLRKGVLQQLGVNYPVDEHFKPRYKPWEQRMILSKDGELFDALRKPNTEIVTDTIKTVDTTGILTSKGKHIDADIIITATGLHVDPIGNTRLSVDNQVVNVGKCWAWRALMLEGVPNFGLITGFLVGSYTPGASAQTDILISVIKHAEKAGYASARPEVPKGEKEGADTKSFMSMTSTYFVEASDRLPVITGKGVWYGRETLWKDTKARWFGSLTDGMRYERAADSGGRKKVA